MTGRPRQAAPPPRVGVQNPGSTGSLVVQRSPDLTPQDRLVVENAEQLITKAKTNRDAAAGSLKRYASQAPTALGALKGAFEGSLTLYENASRTVDRVVESAKGIKAVRESLLQLAVDAAFGAVSAGIVGKMRVFKETQEGLLDAFRVEGFKALVSPVANETGKAIASEGMEVVTKTVAGVGGGDAVAPPGGGAPPWASELAFYKTYSSLLGTAMPMVGMANAVGDVSGPIGKIEQAIKDLGVANRVLSYPLDQLEKDAASLESGTRALGAAAPGVAALVEHLQSLVTLATASAPRSEAEVERELWTQWVSDLHPDDIEMLDETTIEDHLKRLGIWDQLGVDITGWFSDAEQAIAVCSAAAQAKVLEHRGQSVGLDIFRGTPASVQVGRFKLRVELESGPVAVDPNKALTGSGVIVGARAVRQADESVLDKGPRERHALAEYLLSHGYIGVVVRPYQLRDLDASGSAETPETVKPPESRDDSDEPSIDDEPAQPVPPAPTPGKVNPEDDFEP